jgi:response regulator RpfG family c-di-GMP phosphodiesterase
MCGTHFAQIVHIGKKLSKKKAWEYILGQSGKHLDPQVVKAFLAMVENE